MVNAYGTQSIRPLYTTMIITSVSADGASILAEDALGKTYEMNGRNRPKGTALPAEKEIWLADKSTGSWQLVSQFNHAPIPEVSSADPVSIIKALSAMGLVVDKTTRSVFLQRLVGTAAYPTTPTPMTDLPPAMVGFPELVAPRNCLFSAGVMHSGAHGMRIRVCWFDGISAYQIWPQGTTDSVNGGAGFTKSVPNLNNWEWSLPNIPLTVPATAIAVGLQWQSNDALTAITLTDAYATVLFDVF